MNTEQLTCTIGQAKKLQELGIVAPGVFFASPEGDIYYYCIKTTNDTMGDYYCPDTCEYIEGGEFIPLYTLGELMRMANFAGSINCYYRDGKTFWRWQEMDNEIDGWDFDTPEQAAADMVIKLLNDDYITPEHCNAALGEKE